MTKDEDLFYLKKNKDADFADKFEENTIIRNITIEDKKVDKISQGFISGTGIRIIKGKEIEYSFHSNKNISQNLNFEENLEDIILELLKAEKQARKVSNLIKQVSVSFSQIIQDVRISNSDNNSIKGLRQRTRFLINVIASDGNEIQTGYETAGGTYNFASLLKENIKSLSVSAAERAVKMLKAKHAPKGKMPVVILSEAGGTLIHEACGHGLEADFIEKGISVYKKIGEKVASDLITVIDDATIPNLYGSFEFDDEGTPAKKKILIENGILKNFMSDRYYANLLNIQPSGNARRENYTETPQPRMTNTFILPGNSEKEEIISSLKEGLLIKKLGGGQVNVTNGDFVFDVQESYRISKGKIKEPLRGATLIGNGPEILKNVDMVGNDLHFITGTCGKGDHAPVTDAMPTIRIKEITVGGRD